jgi:predicted ABC-type ATPase
MESPRIVILAGPNGAGKSTSQKQLIPPFIPFVNADDIARELREQGQSSGTSADIAAGRLLLKRLDELETQLESFAVETNLANKTLAQRIPRWQKAGYKVAVYYLSVPNPEFAVARVAYRVLSGGHDIPEATIRRRYYLGLRNFFDVYAPIADRWRLYDSSHVEGPQLVERGVRQVRNREDWERIRAIAFSAEGKTNGERNQE